jgi:adenosine deaminase
VRKSSLAPGDIFRNFLIPASGTEDRRERFIFEVLEDLAAQNVRYAEPIAYPPFHMTQGLNVRQVLGAVQHAMRIIRSGSCWTPGAT